MKGIMVSLSVLIVLLLSVVPLASSQDTTNSTAENTTTAAAPTTTPAPVPTTAAAPVTGTVLNSNLTAGDGEAVEYEYEPYDGWYNNLINPDWGAIDGILLRPLKPSYADGVFAPGGADRGNPFTLSTTVFGSNGGSETSQYVESERRTAFMVFFGQQVVEEILDSQRPGCPPEYHDIEIPAGHKLNKEDEESDDVRYQPFLRTRYNMKTGFSPNNPRQQLNEITPFLDGGLVYGTSKAWSDLLRSFKDGKLASTPEKDDTVAGTFPAYNDKSLPMANPPPPKAHYLKKVDRFYRLGNPRGQENPFVLTLGVIWFRYHNYLAMKIKKENDEWEDEQIFNEARKWVIATYQKIVMEDWLPSWLGDDFTVSNYIGYDPYKHPGITQEFQTAAMRFGHTLVPPAVIKRDKTQCQIAPAKDNDESTRTIRTCNSFWESTDILGVDEEENEVDLEEMILGLLAQPAGREDTSITEDLRGFVFGPLEFSRRDLMAVNIQRGRDHGLPDYNTARVFYGLDRVESLDDINNGTNLTDILDDLKKMFPADTVIPDKLDIWVGGMLETTEAGPGPLFQQIILDQFVRIRAADRFWFENYKMNGLFTEDQVNLIKATSVRDVLLKITDIDEAMIQSDPFRIDNRTSGGCVLKLTDNNIAEILEECTAKEEFDYFSGSEVSYALTFLLAGIAAVLVVVLMVLLSKFRQHRIRSKAVKERGGMRASKKAEQMKQSYGAEEWVGHKDGTRQVRVKMEEGKKLVTVLADDANMTQLRAIDLKNNDRLFIQLSNNKGFKLLLLKVPREYDLALTFDATSERNDFNQALEDFLAGNNVYVETIEQSEKMMKNNAVTKRARQKRVDMFFKAVFQHAFKLSQDEEERRSFSSKDAQEVVSCELSRQEFADALGMRPRSLFLENLFPLVDKDGSGYVTFREFLDLIVIFAKGDAKEKAKLLFNMHDLDGSGTLSRKEFYQMIKSLMELSGQTVDESNVDSLMDSMMSHAGITSKDELEFSDFQKLFGDHSSMLSYARLGWTAMDKHMPRTSSDKEEKLGTPAASNTRQTIHRAYSMHPARHSQAAKNSRLTTKVVQDKRKYPDKQSAKYWHIFQRYISNYKLQIFWILLWTLVLFGIFVERAYYYSVEREHTGLRGIAGYGVTVTRGAASSMMFAYSTLLLSMCRNTITFLRETFAHRFIPFDSAIASHKYMAFWALFFTLIHIIGHAINFYHVSTQTANDLTCLFRDYFHGSHELPKFHDWCYRTITGMTGVLVTLHTAIIYAFALQYTRRNLFNWFWLTHGTYAFFYILFVMHGSGRLVQDPLFQWFFFGPAILFIFDKFVSFSRKKIEVPVIKAEQLPSDVLSLYMKRPVNFEYLSGQWVRIACLELGKSEYHPFTLSSAPHEEYISLHIRAVGPWTNNLRKIYNPLTRQGKSYPKVYIDGPYGEGHQDWYKYPVAVLVGGGIGVTPFTSILKDIVFKSKTGYRVPCKKVYFIWVTRTQKQFEWVTDVIRDVENADDQDLVSVHIFITQFQQKFDLRTTMLYVCERHFQKVSGRSLFTGLQSITHFGRPDFASFLDSLQDEHPDAHQIGVFSCGPPPMTQGVEKACAQLNKQEGPTFTHHFENF